MSDASGGYYGLVLLTLASSKFKDVYIALTVCLQLNLASF